MSLEDELRSNTVALDALNQSIDQLVGLLSGLSLNRINHPEDAPAADEQPEEKAPEKVDKEPEKEPEHSVDSEEELKKEYKEDSKHEKDSVEPAHTQKELKDLLGEYKERHGLPLAKKLLPKISDNKFKTSSDVTPDCIDDIYDRVHEVVYGADL